MNTNTTEDETVRSPALARVLIGLMKGVVYQENDASLWQDLFALQPRVRDYVAVLGLELILDEAEGEPELPRLVQRRALSFPVSLLLALLRKKLAESEAGGGGYSPDPLPRFGSNIRGDRIERLGAEIIAKERERKSRLERAEYYSFLARELGLPLAADLESFLANRDACSALSADLNRREAELQNLQTEAGVELRAPQRGV